jgi:hypothetical protein
MERVRRNIERLEDDMARHIFCEMCRCKFKGDKKECDEKLRGLFKQRMRGPVEETTDLDVWVNFIHPDMALELTKIEKYNWFDVSEITGVEESLIQVYSILDLPIF